MQPNHDSSHATPGTHPCFDHIQFAVLITHISAKFNSVLVDRMQAASAASTILATCTSQYAGEQVVAAGMCNQDVT